MKNKILVTGSDGQLGCELKKLSTNFKSHEFFFTNRSSLDITNKDSVLSFVNSNNINIIINCAAYTAVDDAEDNEKEAIKVNVLAVQYLSEVAKEKKCKLIHVSTDYVFDGKAFRPYSIEDKTKPINVYGKTKLEGEQAMIKINPINSCIIRTSWLYSTFGHNFVKTMLRLSKERDELSIVADQVGSPTYAEDLADVILTKLIEIKNHKTEVYHYANEGVATWYDFAKTIVDLSEIDCKIHPIPSTKFPTKAKRPFYSVLDKEKIKTTFNFTIYHWRDRLKECLSKLN